MTVPAKPEPRKALAAHERQRQRTMTVPAKPEPLIQRGRTDSYRPTIEVTRWPVSSEH
ncbi:hypothetical protein GALL_214410 [mine drainage metagenome]|uniref:Uncharacterized protein n=1 Tax=mine drainage metagenome TaxID=410659 RepID=A0A1J5RXD2_9ZZZZ